MTNRQTAKYAFNIFEVAQEQNKIEEINDQLHILKKIAETSPEINTFLNSKIIKREEKINLIENLKDFKIEEILINFLKILVINHNFILLPQICQDYQSLYNEEQNLLIVKVTTAKQMTDKNKELLKNKLEEKLKKKISLDLNLQPDLIGGIKLNYNGMEIDNTIKTYFEKFSASL